MEEEERVRGGHRAMATRYIKKIEEELVKTDPDKEALRSFCEELEVQKREMTRLDEVIQRKMDSESIVKDMEVASEKRMAINKAVKRARDRLSDGGVTSASNTQSEEKTARLPKITLPLFSGDPLQYNNFWDSFKHSVHDRSDLPGATKFNYLTGQLRGEAARLLSDFSRCDEDYKEAVELFQSTYGKPNLIMQAHLNEIFDMTEPGATSTELSKFRSDIESHICSIKVLGTDTESAGFVFAAIILRKLPTKLRDSINRAEKVDSFDLTTLRSAIEKEIQHLCSSEDEDPNAGKADVKMKRAGSKSTSTSQRTPHKGSANALNVTSNESKFFCPLCNGKHNVFDCSKFSSTDDKRTRVVDLKLCFNCLRAGHNAFKCSNVKRCKECNRKHHTVLCTKQSVDNDQVVKENSSALNVGVNVSCKQFSTLLPTAVTPIMLKNGKTFNSRCLFDQGSQRSFILDKLVDRLKMRKVDKIREAVDGFNKQGNVKEYDVVEFSIFSADGPVIIQAFVVDSFPSRISMIGRGNLVHKLKLEASFS